MNHYGIKVHQGFLILMNLDFLMVKFKEKNVRQNIYKNLFFNCTFYIFATLWQNKKIYLRM
jgi:hypothetical protein